MIYVNPGEDFFKEATGNRKGVAWYILSCSLMVALLQEAHKGHPALPLRKGPTSGNTE